MRKPKDFERAYKSWLAGKTLGTLLKTDKEPKGEDFDLSEWESGQIINQIKKEKNG